MKMELKEAVQRLENAGLICEWSATGLDEFVEYLSNCCGHVTGDEIVFRKIRNASMYTVNMRNHGRQLANIEYDYDKHKLIVRIFGLSPDDRTIEEVDRDASVEKVREIGKRIHDIAEKRAHNHL